MKKFDIKKLAKLIPIIGIILLIYMIHEIGTEDIASTFVLIPIHVYILAFIPFFLRLTLFTYKWQYLCRKQKMEYSFPYLMKIFLISLFYGNVTPGGFGWHIRIFYLRKKSKATIEKCLANSLIDSQTGFITGLFLSIIGSIILIEWFPGLLPLLILLLIINLTILIVFMKRSGGGRIFKYLIRPLIPSKYKEQVDKSVDNLYEDIPQVRDLFIPFIIEIGMYFVAGAQFYIIAQAFSLDIPYITFVMITAITAVATGVLPISVGGLGVREGAFVYLLHTAYNVDPSIAIVISLSGFVVKRLIPSFIGLGISLKKENRFPADF